MAGTLPTPRGGALSAETAPTRRAVLGVIAGAPMLAIPTVALASAASASPLSARIAAFTRQTDYMNKNVDDNATWETWQDSQCALLVEVEALPLTAENARIRAQAIMMIHMGEEYLPHMFDNDPATDARLAIGIIRTLAAEAQS